MENGQAFVLVDLGEAAAALRRRAVAIMTEERLGHQLTGTVP
jgi:hypothetical protein